MILGPLDEVGHDQEVSGEAHIDDNIDLELKPVKIDRALLLSEIGIGCQPRFQTSARIFRQHPRFARQVARKAGKDGLAVRRRKGAALGDHQRVGGCFGQIGEGLLHHRRRFDEGLRVGAGPIISVDLRRIGNAQHRVMRLVHVRLSKVGGVGGDQRQTPRIGQVNQRVLGLFAHRVAVTGKFDIEPPRKQRLQPISQPGTGLVLAFRQQPGQTAFTRAGQRDQPFGTTIKIVERNVRIALQRAVKVRG